MHIEWAVTCRYGESDGATATLLGAGTDVLLVQQIPGPVALFLAARLAAPADELQPGQTHELTARVLAPNGNPVTAPDGQPVPPLAAQLGSQTPVQQLVPGWLVNPLVVLGIQWWATETGSYSIELTVDGGETHLSPVHVLDANNPPEPT